MPPSVCHIGKYVSHGQGLYEILFTNRAVVHNHEWPGPEVIMNASHELELAHALE